MSRDPIVIQVAMAQGVNIVIGKNSNGRTVGVETLLMVHYSVDGILSSALSHRAAPAGPPGAVPGDDRPAFDSPRRHRLGRDAVVVHYHGRLRLRVLDAVQRTGLLLLLPS